MIPVVNSIDTPADVDAAAQRAEANAAAWYAALAHLFAKDEQAVDVAALFRQLEAGARKRSQGAEGDIPLDLALDGSLEMTPWQALDLAISLESSMQSLFETLEAVASSAEAADLAARLADAKSIQIDDLERRQARLTRPA